MTRRNILLMEYRSIGVAFAIILISCSSPTISIPILPAEQAEQVVAFDSGVGTGQYDKMTYFEYKSEIAFTPDSDISITAIRPQIWYSNGTSGFLAIIRDEHWRPLASEAGLVDGKGYMTPAFSDRHLDNSYTLKADSTYLIIMSVWTTKSVGIYTTGNRTEGTVGNGTYQVRSGKSNTVDHLDRGGIAFQLIK